MKIYTVGDFREALRDSGLNAYATDKYYEGLSDDSPMSDMNETQSITVAKHIAQSWYTVSCFLNVAPEIITNRLHRGYSYYEASVTFMNYVRGKSV